MPIKSFSILLEACLNLQSLVIERCHIEDSIPCNMKNPLKQFKKLVISDSATCPINPILWLCNQTELESLDITGCNFNESNMCDLVSSCPLLKTVRLGSHVGASLTAIGSAGGDLFAETLVKNCHALKNADLTGIISMTDQGWNKFIRHFGQQLEKLSVRRAVQISSQQLELISICINLRHLTFSNVPHLMEQNLIAVLKLIGRQLIFLQLESVPVSDLTMTTIVADCENLTQLRLYHCYQLENLDLLFFGDNMKSLTALSLQYCHGLTFNRECGCEIDSFEEIDLATLPFVPRIKDVSYMSPYPIQLSSPTRQLDENELKGCCNIPIGHLEIIDCEGISSKGIKCIVKHLPNLKRFIFVGAALDSDFRKYLYSKHKLKTSVYVLTPSTPNFN